MDYYFEEKIKAITDLQLQLEKAENGLLEYLRRKKTQSTYRPHLTAIHNRREAI